MQGQTNTRQERMQEIIMQLQEGVAEVFTNENYLHFLNMMSMFHNYSVNNCILILSQNPLASRVASFATWKKLGCSVRKGSKGIKILVPIPYKYQKEKRSIDENGDTVEETVEAQSLYFKIGHVFDRSQVDGDLPNPCEELQYNSDSLHLAVERIIVQNHDISYDFELKPGDANGYCRLDTKEIFLRPNMSDLQTLKTIIHEKAHQLLHTSDSEQMYTREEAEVQAESCAYVALQHFQNSTGMQLESSSYSFPYIATWASGRELKELRSSLEVIKKTSDELIRWLSSETDLQLVALV